MQRVKGCRFMKRKLLAIFLVLAMLIPFTASGFAAQTVSAAVAVESFALHKTAVSLDVGKTATFSIVSVVPSDATGMDTGLWTSSNTDVVKMTGNVPGQIRALAPGKATITYTVNGVAASCVVTVSSVDKPVTSFALHKAAVTLVKGKTATLSIVDILPAGATNVAGAKWFTSHSANVSYTGNVDGQIRALKAGRSTLTCQIGSVKAYCVVTVVDPDPVPPQEQKLEMNFADMTVYAVTLDEPGSPSAFATNMELLFNQQNADPRVDSSVSAHDDNKYWNYGGTNRYMLVDLGAEYDITELYMWNRFPMNGYADFSLWYATSLGDWDTAFTAKSDEEGVLAKLNAEDSVWTKAFASVYQHDYDMWVSEDINGKVRYLIFSSVYTGNGSGGTIYTDACFSEWIFYGSPVVAG